MSIVYECTCAYFQAPPDINPHTWLLGLWVRKAATPMFSHAGLVLATRSQ